MAPPVQHALCHASACRSEFYFEKTKIENFPPSPVSWMHPKRVSGYRIRCLINSEEPRLSKLSAGLNIGQKRSGIVSGSRFLEASSTERLVIGYRALVFDYDLLPVSSCRCGALGTTRNRSVNRRICTRQDSVSRGSL